MSTAKVKQPVHRRDTDLRSTIQANDQRVHAFCVLMLQGEYSTERLALSILEAFCAKWRKLQGSNAAELEVELFSIAWDRIKQAAGQEEYRSVIGRDTRDSESQASNLLDRWHQTAEKHSAEIAVIAAARLWRIDTDQRAAVILHDIFRMDDNQSAQILQLRWGIFRQRLHRGRSELLRVFLGEQSSLATTDR